MRRWSLLKLAPINLVHIPSLFTRLIIFRTIQKKIDIVIDVYNLCIIITTNLLTIDNIKY